MLLPFDFAILTKEEVDILYAFITKHTMVEGGGSVSYKKMKEAGVSEIYEKLYAFKQACYEYTCYRNPPSSGD
jgi:hypothetical protein